MGGDQVGRLDRSGHVGADDVRVGQGQLGQPGPRHVRLAAAQTSQDPLLVRLPGQLVLAVSDEDQGPAGRAPADVVVLVLLLGRLALVPVVIPPECRRRGQRSGRETTATTNLSY